MRNVTNQSIHRRLLFWLMLPLCSLWLVMTVISSQRAYDFTTAAYDHELANSADSIAARLKTRSGSMDVQLPDAARQLLLHGNNDRFFYEVFDQYGKHLAGQAILKFMPVTGFDAPIFANGTIQGQAVRISSIKVRSEDEQQQTLIIEVAETLNSRNNFSHQLLISMVAPDVLLIVLCALLLYGGITRGLQPLTTLRNTIAQRSPSDLSPVPEHDVPPEVAPLVESINTLLNRLRFDIDAQRRFVANAAHQFRTPVAGLKTYVGYAKRLVDKGEIATVLEQIDQGTDRLTRMADKLLSLAKAEPTKSFVEGIRLIDLNDVAEAAVRELLLPAQERSIELSFIPAEEPAIASGNAQAIFELVTNLVENAVLYNHSGGNVLVRVSVGPPLCLCVEDNGPGIPESERERVFERFYRILGNSASGSGLGLAIVKEIADAHQATVSLESNAGGVGTIARVCFPSSSSAAVSGAEHVSVNSAG